MLASDVNWLAIVVAIAANHAFKGRSLRPWLINSGTFSVPVDKP